MTTFNLEIPELEPLQSSPHIPINAALRRIDALLSLGVLTFQTLNSPPGSPAEGDKHIVGAAPSGGWSAFDPDMFVYYANGVWEGVYPVEGLLVWSIPDTTLYVYSYEITSAGAWEPLFVLP